MIESIRVYVVKAEFRGQFELAYGPGGGWSQLLEPHDGFRGITLLRDVHDGKRYVEISIWDSGGQRNQSLASCQPAYDALISTIEKWTESITDLGVFSVLGSAKIRSQPKPGRRLR